MLRDALSAIYGEFIEWSLPDLVFRDLKVGPAKRGRAVAIIGPRRAGKTYTLFQLIKGLRSEGLGHRVLYLNFEDDRLHGLSLGDLDEILRVFRELNPEASEGRLYLFFDEVQIIEGWERYIRRLLDTEDAEIYVSGSSSRLLSRELATSMRGRSLPHTVLPFSFGEILKVRNLSIKVPITSRVRSRVLATLRDYLMFGGFPEVVLEENKVLKLRLLREYVDVMLLRDVIERHGLRNIPVLRGLLTKVVSSVSSEFSINRYHGQLKSQSISVSKDTLYEYFDHLEEAFAIVPVKRLGPKLIQLRQSLPKVYPIDMGMLTQTMGRSSDDFGKYMEATVAIELTRRRNDDPLMEVYYWKDPHGKEVDFVVKHGTTVTTLIQVCYDISSSGTRMREVRALIKASKELGCRDLIVLTWDHEEIEEHDGRTIRYIPLWSWLLEHDP